ncbi:hypothetical protein NDU88_005781 [Pleurodeles waltl]|uniref:Uncharacterized protein n=1 Tax=Pleurodeles waltl TaxID=8319 RepID=A0AAV7TVR7_PLEWA|nr:hypothetical protein NDU88_005781 [Pleurodeles waltl]
MRIAPVPSLKNAGTRGCPAVIFFLLFTLKSERRGQRSQGWTGVRKSDLSSVDLSFSESEGSETSEAGNKSPSNELTVQQYRQRKLVVTRPGSQGGFENAASMSGRTLKWDYSGIGLADIPTSGSQGPVNEKIDTGASAGNPATHIRWAPRQGSCSQYIAQLKSCKLSLGSKAGAQGSLQRDCRGRSIR